MFSIRWYDLLLTHEMEPRQPLHSIVSKIQHVANRYQVSNLQLRYLFQEGFCEYDRKYGWLL